MRFNRRLMIAAAVVTIVLYPIVPAIATPNVESSAQDKKSRISQTIWERDWDAHERKRDELFKIDKGLDTLGIKPGMVLAEVGGGFGYVVFKLADRVGPTGKVINEEIWEEAIEFFKHRAAEKGYTNVECIIGTREDPKLPAASLDFVFIHATMRSLQKPVEILNNIAPSLKPGGKLVVIEQEEGRAVGTNGDPQPAGYNRTRNEYLDLFAQAGFQVDRIDDTSLPYDIIFVLSVKD
jgi:ubiquinone/menaquinone biosynthesis C-methylase UbiE